MGFATHGVCDKMIVQTCRGDHCLTTGIFRDLAQFENNKSVEQNFSNFIPKPAYFMSSSTTCK